jgi:ATP-dependent Lon protease
VNINDGIDVCHDFMEKAKSQLDNCVYGLDDAKLQIMQMMGQWVSNPSAMGTAIAIKGPMGTGKTTLVKEGISKILGREFSFIALGGNSDSSFLEGHSYTYEGSTWGKIVQTLIESKCMNPVFYFDELDKVSDTPKGEEIIGILTHLTDTTQNNQFHDKYFSEVEFDLSKCLFIFSYNDESKVNPILRDRMYRIQTKGYEQNEKLIIARDHLLPTIRQQVGFNEEDVIIPDETINYIVSSEHLTAKEQGVRNLKRCLEIIHTKLNLFRLVKKDSKVFEKDMDIEISFPITVTQKHIDTFIKKEEHVNQSLLAMYI